MNRDMGYELMKVAVLMTCHNRVHQTLCCLQHLFACDLPPGISFDVWLNDDGCIDGTGDAVRAEYPSIKIVDGSGNDYWCGGMRRAWDAAATSFDYDGYLWLNDDTWLVQGGLAKMLGGEEDSMIVGAICNREQTMMTYGGMLSRGGLVQVDGTYRPVEKAHGNCVYVPRKVFEKLGNFMPYFTHAIGDSDYSRRALKAGFKLLLTPAWVATCDVNTMRPKWTNPHVRLTERIHNLYSPLSYCEPWAYFRYCRYHDGLLVAIKSYVLQHIRVLFPDMWER